MKSSTFVENKPNISIEADNIDQYLEPEGLLPDYAYMEAAVAELSDRVHTNKWLKNLEAPLVVYDNGAKPPEDPSVDKESAKGARAGSPGSTDSKSESKPESGGAKITPDNKTAKPSTHDKSVNPKPAAKEGSSPKEWPFAR